METIKDAKQALKGPNSTNAKPSTPASRTGKNGMLEIKAISLQDDIDEQSKAASSLTMGLAVWWLHMMAADKHGVEDAYPPLRSAA